MRNSNLKIAYLNSILKLANSLMMVFISLTITIIIHKEKMFLSIKLIPCLLINWKYSLNLAIRSQKMRALMKKLRIIRNNKINLPIRNKVKRINKV